MEGRVEHVLGQHKDFVSLFLFQFEVNVVHVCSMQVLPLDRSGFMLTVGVSVRTTCKLVVITCTILRLIKHQIGVIGLVGKL